MAKYRLIWERDGALDLSQVLDDRGKPILFTKKGDFVTVDSVALQNPFVKRYLGSGIKHESLDGTPAVPKAPEATPIKAAVTVIPEPVVATVPEPIEPEPKPEKVPPIEEPPIEEPDAPEDETDESDDAADTTSDSVDTGSNTDGDKVPARKRGKRQGRRK